MPLIKVWCLPKSSEEELNSLYENLIKEILSVSELGFKDEKEMTFLFVPDLMKQGLGNDIIVEITGLFEKPNRTLEVKNLLAEKIVQVVRRLYPNAKKIECLVYSFNPIAGFYSSKKE